MWNRCAGGLVAIALVALGTTRAAGQGAPIVDLMRERILAHLDLKPGMKVAEIGVGPGWFVMRVAERIGTDGIVYGTDIDPKRIEALKARLPDIGPGRVELRLCRDGRDTAIDDLPDGSLDLVLMIDSLCFDAEYPRASNVEYLRRFQRALRSGGRLVHHMDCRCDVTIEGLAAQCVDAGFSPRFETLDVAPDPAHLDASWPCRSEAERTRHAFVGIFRKP
jgi:ubiquinone/menaquinone biosynthesis C-methylase UbiE